MEKVEISTIIQNDLKAFPWLKLLGFNPRKLEAYYFDKYHGDLWKRYTNMDGFGLLHVGRLTEYNELIKDKNVQ